jgi:hypothetical protein
MRNGPHPLSGGAFHTTAAVSSFPRLLGRYRCCYLLWLACLFTVHLRDFPYPTFWGLGCSALFATCLFFIIIQLLVYYSVCFFLFFFPPGWGSVFPGCYADLAQGCLWEYLVVCDFPSSLGAGVWRCRQPPGFSI